MTENDEETTYLWDDKIEEALNDLLAWGIREGWGTKESVVVQEESPNALFSFQYQLKGYSHWLWAVGVSSCGKFFASGSRDNSITLWEESGAVVHTLTGHSGQVTTVSFANSDNLLVSGSIDKKVKVWRIDTGECLFTLNGHPKEIIAAVFSPNSLYIASRSSDTTLKIWERENNWQVISTLEVGKYPYVTLK